MTISNNTTATKQCTRCKLEKLFSEFGKDSRCHDGKNIYCQDCIRAKGTACRAKHREEVKVRQWVKRNLRKYRRRIISKRVLVAGKRRCTWCGLEKSFDEFSNQKKGRHGKRPRCRDCISILSAAYWVENRKRMNAHRRQQRDADLEYFRQKARQWVQANPGLRRKHVLASRHGITPEIYEGIAEMQGGVCAICKRSETANQQGDVPTLTVDHDHKTGEIRGLLCGTCNSMLGMAHDDTDRLEAGAAYLRRGGIDARDIAIPVQTSRS